MTEPLPEENRKLFSEKDAKDSADDKNVAIVRLFEELQNDASLWVWKDTTAFSKPGIGEVQVEEMRKAWSEELRKRVSASDAKRKLTVYGPIDDPDYV